ncbi:aspartate/glutamate racemase family protein [Luteimonas suaedae]|uniref:aspartate/glutamate racemase family protein n=1 Tax=Luteimonas suaedae TaxID=2605430 RepID=UPI0011ED967B|nr:aspartate/glutamate racemase family protein [Luteimonas suaedae]
METIGLLGGMSWESTALYYRLINQTVRERLGGLHSARLLLYSVDFAEIEPLQHAGDWDGAGRVLGAAARALRDGGAERLVLCTNTMHKVADAIEAAAGLPLLHIADPTGAAIRAAGFTRVGLLATRFTMEQAFYRRRLAERHGLDVRVPDADARERVHRVIYEELCLGVVRDASREAYRRIIAQLVDDGAECIVLGCTEICLLIGDGDAEVPLFDTTMLHARAAAVASLAVRGGT